MKVHGPGNQHTQAMGQLKRQRPQEEREGKLQVKEASFSKLETKSAVPISQSQGEAKGVIRLLQEGHFKGVADVRLRINFHAQLQYTTTQSATSSLEAEGQELISNLEEKVQGLGQTFNFVADHAQGFMVTFRQTVETSFTSPGDGQFDANSVLGEFREAFDGLFNALWGLETEAESGNSVAATVETGNSETSPVVDPIDSTVVSAGIPEETIAETEPEPSAFQVALGGLEEWFNTELQSLETHVDELFNLPSLAGPSGNGIAYERFLEMYNQLHDPTKDRSDEAGPEKEDGIETSA